MNPSGSCAFESKCSRPHYQLSQQRDVIMPQTGRLHEHQWNTVRGLSDHTAVCYTLKCWRILALNADLFLRVVSCGCWSLYGDGLLFWPRDEGDRLILNSALVSFSSSNLERIVRFSSGDITAGRWLSLVISGALEVSEALSSTCCSVAFSLSETWVLTVGGRWIESWTSLVNNACPPPPTPPWGVAAPAEVTHWHAG